VVLTVIGAVFGSSATSSTSYKDGYAEMNQFMGGSGPGVFDPHEACLDDVVNNIYFGIPRGDDHALFMQGCEAAASVAIQQIEHPGSGS
jgi:hypothetical protein